MMNDLPRYVETKVPCGYRQQHGNEPEYQCANVDLAHLALEVAKCANEFAAGDLCTAMYVLRVIHTSIENLKIVASGTDNPHLAIVRIVREENLRYSDDVWRKLSAVEETSPSKPPLRLID